jgi:hypothetical protein
MKMKEIWARLRMILATPKNRGLVTAADLHKAIDEAVAAGWQSQKEGDEPWFKRASGYT